MAPRKAHLDKLKVGLKLGKPSPFPVSPLPIQPVAGQAQLGAAWQAVVAAEQELLVVTGSRILSWTAVSSWLLVSDEMRSNARKKKLRRRDERLPGTD